MSDNQLINIMQLLHRHPYSQTDLRSMLGLSKSHLSALVKSLISQDLVEHYSGGENKPAGGMGRPREVLTVRTDRFYTVLISHTTQGCSVSLLHYGNVHPCHTVELPVFNHAADLVNNISRVIDEFIISEGISRSAILCQVAAVQASLEQGFDGTIFRDNVITEVNFNLARMLLEATKIPAYVCNLAYGHLLGLLAKAPKIEHALVFMCGDGAVGMGLVINGQVILGPHEVFPECSHLEFPGGFEASLGSYGPKMADALEFAVVTLAPIFKTPEVVVSGVAFDGHEEVIADVQKRLKSHPKPLMHCFKLSYRPLDKEARFAEYSYLSFDLAIRRLNPQAIKRNLQEKIGKEAYI